MNTVGTFVIVHLTDPLPCQKRKARLPLPHWVSQYPVHVLSHYSGDCPYPYHHPDPSLTPLAAKQSSYIIPLRRLPTTAHSSSVNPAPPTTSQSSIHVATLGPAANQHQRSFFPLQSSYPSPSTTSPLSALPYVYPASLLERPHYPCLDRPSLLCCQKQQAEWLPPLHPPP